MLGFISVTEKGGADRLLAELAERLRAEGAPLVAMVRAETPAARPCEMHLRLLPAEEVRAISQELGSGADACTLDAGALEEAVAATARAIEAAPASAALILNKFGKQEAAGRGCRDLIGLGLARGMRVLISVPPETRAEFEAFSDGLAEELRPEIQQLADFVKVSS
ncbi:DUF2478 domain-containing protein [Sedimentimonas flavescens]|uniref:DUF2478 domain-containing protein n=1 Tax=Sedimentimonas flavescens TaxID=2851012 RepID=UPI001C4A1078|nr:DUF2478 domain-containing protein [Sedimentimonas flavescens]MBW0158761.1 DUF2478 domain-containing protein [Sedimentimonas flavescens]MCT2540231.1 DUF2478 domain-containing protein [Sedimentimonas flavescens]WBL34010.1 DUF2478 domain-containing protein [Sinirhodobacter sp. HNIBRBA609]